MAIEFDCSGCGRTYRVVDAFAGKRTKCKTCDAILSVPIATAGATRRPPLQTFGGGDAARPAPPAGRSPGPAAPPARDLYGLDDEDERPLPRMAPVDDEPDEVRGPGRPGRGGKPTKSRVEYAGFWRRAAAVVVDGLLLFAIQIAASFAYGVCLGIYYVSKLGRAPTPDELAPAIVVFQVAWVIIVFLYVAGMTASSYQATLGKIALGIKVCDLEGRRIGFGKSLVRELARAAAAACLLIGLVMAAFTERKQGLHDILVGTLVIRA